MFASQPAQAADGSVCHALCIRKGRASRARPLLQALCVNRAKFEGIDFVLAAPELAYCEGDRAKQMESKC